MVMQELDVRKVVVRRQSVSWYEPVLPKELPL